MTKRILKTKNIIIGYNIITIIKYALFRENILYIDFITDFIFINIMLLVLCLIYNKLTLINF